MTRSDPSSPPVRGAETRVCLGVVAGVHGVRGLVRIKSFTEDPQSIAAYGPLSDESGQRRFELQVKGLAKGAVLAAIAGVRDRNQAETLRGTRLYVPRSALPEPEDEEEFYNADLIGLRVEDGSGAVLGQVKAMHNFGGGDLLEVLPSKGKSWLLPFTRTVVPVVDLAGGRVVVEPPEEIVVRDGEAGSEA